MKQRLKALLCELYSSEQAELVAHQLAEISSSYRAQITPPPDAYDPQFPVDETDAFLMCDAEYLQGEAKKPLALLYDFLTDQLEGVVGGVHLLSLPDPAAWNTLKLLTREYRVMLDLPLPAAGGQGRVEPEQLLHTCDLVLRYLKDGVAALRVSGEAEAVGRTLLSLIRVLTAELAPWVILADSVYTDSAGAHLVYEHTLPHMVVDATLRGNVEQLRSWARSVPARLPEGSGYINCLGKHRGIDQPALPPAQRARAFLCSQALMLSLAGVPAVYIDTILGSESENGTREKPRYHALVEELETAGSLRNLVFLGYKDLLRARTLEPLFDPRVPQKVLDFGATVFAVLRSTVQNDGEGLLCIHNLGIDPVELMFNPAELGLDIELGMREIIGGDIVFPADEPAGMVSLEIDAHEVAWLRTPVHLETEEDSSYLPLNDTDLPAEAAELEDQDD